VVSSRTVEENIAAVLDYSQFMYGGAVATPKHVVHASTQVEHGSPPEGHYEAFMVRAMIA
jgi:hypothetical protein